MTEKIPTTSANFCLLQNNQIYEEIYDSLEENELSMQRVEDTDRIIYQIKKIVNSNKNIIISEKINNDNDFLEEIMVQLTKNDTTKTLQGNTLLLYADDVMMYELMYMEDLTIKQKDEDMNQLATISNIELSPVYGNCAILKIGYEHGKFYNKIINKDDIINIITYNFYHTGVLLYSDNTFKEIRFSGDNPNIIIGNTFKQQPPLYILGFMIVTYIEETNDGVKNVRASALLDTEICGRIFVSILCPITNKRFWNITNNTINNIIDIKENVEKKNNIEKELIEEKLSNPFFLIKKNCIL